jgi:HK97 family phage major capsid protein
MSDLADAYHHRDAARNRVAVILEAAQRSGRPALTRDEAIAVAAARADRHAAQADIDAADARSRETVPAGRPLPADRGRAYDQVARIGAEPRQYSEHTDPDGQGFIFDVCRNFLHADPEATERLGRHMTEERVERRDWYGRQTRAAGDANTGAFAGLTVPQYLTDLYAPQISALRPFADVCCRSTPLPPAGMALDISKITTGTSVALQANELDTASSTSIDDTLLTVPVQTAAGQQRVSRQAIDRATGAEAAITQDLMRKHAVAIDSTLITQASTGLTNVAQTITYTSASPTGVEAWPYIYQAASKLEAALVGVAFPSHVVMHSRRWNWWASQVASTWPIISSSSVPAQSQGFALTTEYGPQVRAVLASGLKVVVDNNVPTNLGVGSNQDEVYVVGSDESMYLAEDPNAPLLIRAEQPSAAQLGVLLVVYSYFAYFSRYANPASKISGTGLVAPAGF